MNKTKKVSIVIPCYNEEGNIEALYSRIKSVLNEYDLEFVFVDDYSRDKTLEKIEKLSQKNSTIKYLSFSRNFGHQSALRAGLDHVTGDCTITMDADLQHPPDLLPEMIEKWKEGFEIVYTIRKHVKKTPLIKRVASKIFYVLINSLTDINIKDGSADFRLLDKKIVKVLVSDITEYHLFYRGLVSWIGYNQTGLEYEPNPRYSGKTQYTLKKMLALALDGITSFSTKPLKVGIVLGLILSILSFIYALYALWISIFTSDAVKGWTSVLLSVLFIGGINMVLLGIIGEYIGKIYMQVKRRPFYLIAKTNIKYE